MLFIDFIANCVWRLVHVAMDGTSPFLVCHTSPAAGVRGGVGLDTPIPYQDLVVIARDHLTSWEPLSPWLGLSQAQEEEIRRWREDYRTQKLECLKRWSEMNGGRATYGALISAAEKAENQQLADCVRRMVSREH